MTFMEEIMARPSVPASHVAIACLVLASLVAAPLGAQDATSKTTICLAPTTAQLASGSSVDGATAVRETLGSYLTGPTLAVAPLTARLTSQAREEAKQASCTYVVFTSMKLERNKSGGGLFGKIVGEAVQSSAYELRGRVGGSVAGRVVTSAAASAAAEAARNFATNVKTRDELTFDYRMETLDGAVVVKNNAKSKASSDGQDLLTPMVERAAEAIAGAVTR
jgi:hypothetical protein